MSPILHASSIHLPPNGEPSAFPQPRYEIGHWFVTIYYVSPEQDPDDAPRVEAIAQELRGSLGEHALMFLNQHHPTIPPELAAGLAHRGLLGEMHAAAPDYGHYHVELIGRQRDIGFEALGVMDTLKRHLEMYEGEMGAATAAGDACA